RAACRTAEPPGPGRPGSRPGSGPAGRVRRWAGPAPLACSRRTILADPGPPPKPPPRWPTGRGRIGPPVPGPDPPLGAPTSTPSAHGWKGGRNSRAPPPPTTRGPDEHSRGALGQRHALLERPDHHRSARRDRLLHAHVRLAGGGQGTPDGSLRPG